MEITLSFTMQKILTFFLFFLCFRYVHYFFLFLQIWWNYQGQAWDCWELFNIRPLIPPIDLWMFINTYQIHGFSKIFQGAKVLKGTLHFRNNKDSLEPPSCKTISKNFGQNFKRALERSWRYGVEIQICLNLKINIFAYKHQNN